MFRRLDNNYDIGEGTKCYWKSGQFYDTSSGQFYDTSSGQCYNDDTNSACDTGECKII